MAPTQVLAQKNFGYLQQLNWRVENVPFVSLPSASGLDGALKFDSTNKALLFSDGTNWVNPLDVYTASAGLTLAGHAFSVNADGVTLDTSGSGSSVEVKAGGISATQVSGTLKPSGSAAAGTEALRALGTSASTAAAGNDSRLSDSRAPTGAAGGDLTGTYPNPTIAALAVTDAKVSATAAIARTKLASTGTDTATVQSAVASTTPGSGGFVFGADTNTGLFSSTPDGVRLYAGGVYGVDITATNAAMVDPAAPSHGFFISGNKADIVAGGLDLEADGTSNTWQFSGGPIDVGTHKITSVVDPTSAQDAATKAYVDALAMGVKFHSVQAATTANITLSGTQTIDTRAVVAGEFVLVKNQTTTAQNGVYVVASGSWTRATFADTGAELDGLTAIVEDGAQAGTLWVTTSEVTTIGTDPVVFTQFNSVADIVAGAGLTKTGTTLDVNVDSSTIEINSDILRVKSGGILDAQINGSAAIARTKLASTGDDVATTQTATGSTVTPGAGGHVFTGDTNTGLFSFTADNAQIIAGGLKSLQADTVSMTLWDPANITTTLVEINSNQLRLTGGGSALLLNTSGGFMGAALNMGSHKITSVTDPTSAQDAATKNYVDVHAPSAATDPTAGANGTITAGTLGFARKLSAIITGNAVLTSYAVAHGMGTAYVSAEVHEVTSGDRVEPGINADGTNVTITFDVAPVAAKQYRVVITG